MGDEGPELSSSTTEKESTYEKQTNPRWPESGTDSEEMAEIGPDLTQIIDQWPTLSEEIKQAIMALIK